MFNSNKSSPGSEWIYIESIELVDIGTLQIDEDVYYGFSDNTADMLGTSANNLYIKGGDTIYELAVPHGLGDGNGKVYLHTLRKTSSSASARLVYT